MAERFPTNAGIVYIGQQKYNNLSMYGSTGVVRSQNLDNNTVDVTLSLEPKEKPFGKIIAQKVKEKYFNVRTAAKALGVTPSALGRLMGSLIVMPGRVDIGLNLKVRVICVYRVMQGLSKHRLITETELEKVRTPALIHGIRTRNQPNCCSWDREKATMPPSRTQWPAMAHSVSSGNTASERYS